MSVLPMVHAWICLELMNKLIHNTFNYGAKAGAKTLHSRVSSVVDPSHVGSMYSRFEHLAHATHVDGSLVLRSAIPVPSHIPGLEAMYFPASHDVHAVQTLVEPLVPLPSHPAEMRCPGAQRSHGEHCVSWV